MPSAILDGIFALFEEMNRPWVRIRPTWNLCIALIKMEDERPTDRVCVCASRIFLCASALRDFNLQIFFSVRIFHFLSTEEQTRDLASTVSVDKTNFSVSFNEFLTLMSKEQEIEPDEETLVGVFESFDKAQSGMISEEVFKHIMQGKDDVNEEDINEMLAEYYHVAKLKGLSTCRPEGLKDDDGGPPPPPHPGQRRASKAPSAGGGATGGGSKGAGATSISGDDSQSQDRWINYKGN